MAKSVTVKVEGLRALGESMRGLSESMNKRVARAASAAAAGVVRKAARAKAPKDTGALQKGIVVKRVPPSQSSLTSEHMVTVSTREMRKYVDKSRAAKRKGLVGGKDEYESLGDFFYAHFIEFGTVKMSARPFLRPAFDENKERAIQAMRTAIVRGLERANKQAGA